MEDESSFQLEASNEICFSANGAHRDDHIKAQSASPSHRHDRTLLKSSHLQSSFHVPLQHDQKSTLPACECQCLRMSLPKQTLTVYGTSNSSSSSSLPSSSPLLSLSPENSQSQLGEVEEDLFALLDEKSTMEVDLRNAEFISSHRNQPEKHLFYRRCSSPFSFTTNSFSRYLLIFMISFLMAASFHLVPPCDTQSISPDQFPVRLNRTLTLMQLSQLNNLQNHNNGASFTRKVRQPTMISHYQFCEEPPLVPNAISHLKRNQKHLVFPLGQVSTYMCIQGFKAVGEGVFETRCSLPDAENSSPPMAPSTSGGQFFFPGDSSLPKSSDDTAEQAHVILLGSARSKNSKRLADDLSSSGDISDEEPVINSASTSGHRSVINFPGSPWRGSSKAGRKAEDDLMTSMYDASPTTGSADSGSIDQWHSGHSADSLERRKQKMEKSLRSGRPRWWPPVTLNCQPVTCADPGQVENAVRVHQPPPNSTILSSPENGSEIFTFNSNLHYTCDEGYESAGGIPFLTCRANGQWNREPPRCRLKQCPSLPPLENGRILYNNNERRTDSRAEYHCNAGYRLNAPASVRLCGADDRWSSLGMIGDPMGLPVVFGEGGYGNSTTEDESYRCVKIECPSPPRQPGIRVLNLGRRKPTSANRNYLPGDVIIFTCDSMKTRATAKCRPDGDWSREPPHCPPVTPVCGQLPHFPHGTINVTATKASFSCFEGFQLVGGPSSVTCGPKGVWEESIPRCAVVETSKGKPDQNGLKINGSSIGGPDNLITSSSETGDPAKEKEKSLKTLTILLVSISIAVGTILFIAGWFVLRVRRDKKTRKRWQEYFGRYQHRQSKTHIVMSTTNNFGGGGGTSAGGAGLGMTSSGAAGRGLLSAGRGHHGHHQNRHSGHGHHPNHSTANNGKNYILQTTSSFSSSDNETVVTSGNADGKSFNTGTINSDHARTVSSYADDTEGGEDAESTFFGCGEEEEDYVEEDDDDVYSNASILRLKGLGPPTPATRRISGAPISTQAAQPVVASGNAEMTPMMQLHSPTTAAISTTPKTEHIYSNVPYSITPLPPPSTVSGVLPVKKRREPVPVTEL